MSSHEFPHDEKRDSDDTKQPEREDAVLHTPYPVWAEDTENNPRLWTTRKKWGMVLIVASYTFVR